MISYLIAEFIGNPDRLPFYKNQVFQIMVAQKVFGTKIYVRPTHGYDWKPYVGYDHSFYSLADFFRNWKIVETKVDPNLSRANGFYQTGDPR